LYFHLLPLSFRNFFSCRGTMNCALLFLWSFGYCGHDASCPYKLQITHYLLLFFYPLSALRSTLHAFFLTIYSILICYLAFTCCPQLYALRSTLYASYAFLLQNIHKHQGNQHNPQQNSLSNG